MTPYTHVQTQIAVGTPHVLILSKEVVGFASSQINDLLADIQQNRFNSIPGDFATSESCISTEVNLFHSDELDPFDTFGGEDVYSADALITVPVARAHGIIPIKLEYIGRGEPMPYSWPWED